MQDFIMKNETFKQRVSFLYGFYQFEIRIFHTKTKKALEIRTFFVSTNIDDYGGDEGNRFNQCSHQFANW